VALLTGGVLPIGAVGHDGDEYGFALPVGVVQGLVAGGQLLFPVGFVVVATLLCSMSLGVGAEALREQRVRQAEDRLVAGPMWQDRGLVFASAVGTPLDDHNVRRQFRVITEAAGLGTTWVPRELRHTFVSLLSAHGVPVEAIALLAGHNQTATTELVYRYQIVPALTRGAEVIGQIFG